MLGKRVSVFIRDSLQLMDVVAPAAGQTNTSASPSGCSRRKNLAHQVVWVVLATIHALVVDLVLGSVHAYLAGVGRQLAAEDEMKMRLQDR